MTSFNFGSLGVFVLVLAIVPLAYADNVLPKQDAGYVLVNATSNATLFYWFTPAQNGNPKAPTVVWLQGGPGSSSAIYGFFLEHGPYMLDSEGNLTKREISRNMEFNMLYIDNPVGTGFSFVDRDDGYVTSEDQLCGHLITLFESFFAKHPQLLDNNFFITGESYGGHYIPSIATAILKYHVRAELSGEEARIPMLTGIAIGDGLTDPISQEAIKPEAAFFFGLIDATQLAAAQKLANETVQDIKNGDYASAIVARTEMEDLIANISGVNLMDIRQFDEYDDMVTKIVEFLNSTSTRSALNVGERYFNFNSTMVLNGLADDRMQSTAHMFPLLLSRMRVMLYQGQFDLKDGVVGSAAWVDEIPWSGQEQYQSAERFRWSFADSKRVNRSGGWVKQYGPLTNVVIANAGHLAPMDNPEASYDMIRRFIFDIPFNAAPVRQRSPYQLFW